jgi:RES domain-containing protein
MPDPPADIVEAVSELGGTTWSGVTFRHTAPEREPLSGAGALIFGGRWNPPGLVPTIYLAFPEEACVAEFKRMAEGQGRGPDSFLPRDLHLIDVSELNVLDLTAESSLRRLHLSMADIAGEDWTKCQKVGEAAHLLGLQGILAPSATSLGFVIAAFETNLQRGQLIVRETRALTY